MVTLAASGSRQRRAQGRAAPTARRAGSLYRPTPSPDPGGLRRVAAASGRAPAHNLCPMHGPRRRHHRRRQRAFLLRRRRGSLKHTSACRRERNRPRRPAWASPIQAAVEVVGRTARLTIACVAKESCAAPSSNDRSPSSKQSSPLGRVGHECDRWIGGRGKQVRERPSGERIHAIALNTSVSMATVLFRCLQNAGRSQMSQALFERTAGSTHRALSAGTTPADHVHPGRGGHARARHRPQRSKAPAANPRARRAGQRCGHDGMRRSVPVHPRQALHRLGAPRPPRPTDRGRPRHPRRDRQTYEAARSRALSHLASLRDQPDSDRWLRECCAKELAMNVWRPIRSSSLRNDLIGGAHG